MLAFLRHSEDAAKNSQWSGLMNITGRYDADGFGAHQTFVSLRLTAATQTAAGEPFQRHVQSLHDLMQQGVECGLEEERLVAARQTLNWAQENMEKEVCDICCEEQATNKMDCCGRASGGGRICSECLARILEVTCSCPFCRAPIN